MRLLISYSGVLGGAERALVELADALGAESCLACPPGALAEAARARGLRVFVLHGHRLELRGERLLAAARLAAHAREAGALIDAVDPDLVVAWGMRSALALWLARASRRAPIVFAHNDFLPGPSIGAFVRAAAATFDRVLVPSAAVAADLDPAGRLGDRIAVVNPAVEVESFAALNGRPAHPPEVLVLGALVDWKRPDLALEVVAIARTRRPELRLRLVGAPLGAEAEKLWARLRQRASQPDLEGAVEFVGPVADPRPELSRAMCLLHCAPQEPFGLALVESLASGRPVVAPDAAGPREIVDRSCGILYPPGDAQAGAAAVLRLLDDPAQAAAMGTRGRERARARFDLAQARSRFADVTLVAERHRPSRRRDAAEALALVTVTHNSSSELERLLDSVARHLPGTRVLVVDCASEDRSRDVALQEREGIAIELIALESNEGFGAGCNRGVAAVHEPVAALVNPDVEVIDDSLLALVEEALRPAGPDRLLAPLVLSPDGSRQDTVHPAPASGAELARSVIPPALAIGPLGPALGSRPGAHADRGASAGRWPAPSSGGPTPSPGWGRSTNGSSYTAKTWTSGCAPESWVSRPGSARRRGSSTPALTPPGRPSAASRSSCSPGPGTRSSPGGSGRGTHGSTIRPRRSRSAPGACSSACWAAKRRGSVGSWRRSALCAGSRERSAGRAPVALMQKLSAGSSAPSGRRP